VSNGSTSTYGYPAQLSTASGSAPSSAARAWINFNGTAGTIRASANVTSLTKNGTGDYTINFTTAMSDNNYAISGFASYGPSTALAGILTYGNDYSPATGSVRVKVGNSTSAGAIDSPNASVIVHR
jgi:hypothetical protein